MRECESNKNKKNEIKLQKKNIVHNQIGFPWPLSNDANGQNKNGLHGKVNVTRTIDTIFHRLNRQFAIQFYLLNGGQ